MDQWILAVTAKAPAQGDLISGLLPIILMVAVFWFVMIVPQRKQQKQRKAMLENLKKGDKVVTIGGLHGEVIEFDEEDVKLRVADKTELKFSRSAIARVKG